nr:immunoglobulin heavy chain junction region [Mus musculus]NSM03888.1 immunoglobulin heavy chain junction region [Mus musculus]NSM04031.1 immunoglobulin heavy chain junction region [Mus musculus]NSM04037.1 immunoglobulin heavy chain junction region [Mus musculus]NSM04042.1 immunoglobulin heavy chain junction region [Mus musculus]
CARTDGYYPLLDYW